MSQSETKAEGQGKRPVICQGCAHVWEYGGRNPNYATCTWCYTKTRVDKGVEETEELIARHEEAEEFDALSEETKQELLDRAREYDDEQNSE